MHQPYVLCKFLAGLARVVLHVSFALPSYTFQATHCVLTGFALALHWLRTGFTLGLDYLFHSLWLRSLRTGSHWLLAGVKGFALARKLMSL